MLRRILLPTIFLLLGYGFWHSDEFKTVTAGVAIFLFGMLSMEEGFKTFTGGTLEKILKKSTDKVWKSMSFGVLSTSIMQYGGPDTLFNACPVSSAARRKFILTKNGSDPISQVALLVVCGIESL